MSSNSDDIQAAGSDTRPPMLDRTDYESWSQRIRLYCRGKENGLQILQSIDQGPFELGTTRDALGTTPEGGVLLGPERPRTYEDLSDTEKKRYDADVPKAIWDNVKMLLAGSELTKEDRESQLYDEFERFKMLPGENINEYYVRFHKLVNDMRNIRMTMPNIQLNSKFVNNMSPEWDRFVTAVKLNKGLKETNHEQLYAYLKQHEKHAAQDRLIIERITPATNDQLAFVSTVQPHAQSSHVQSHQYPSSSTNPQSPQYPQFPETSQIDSRYTQTDELLDNLTKQMALLAQSFRATLSQTNNQLRTSSNTHNQATIQDGRVVVQNVQERQNQNQRYFARGNGTTGNGGAHNSAGNANAGQGKLVKCYHCNGVGHIARNFLDEEELLLLAGEQGNTFDADVDNQHVQDLALNEDNIFQADECDAFDSDVDDEPTAQSIFMANLSLVGLANPQAGPSDASILSEVHILENAIDHINDISGVPSCASSALNSVCVFPVNDAFVPHDPIATELKIYKEQVAIYEQHAKFELTEREHRMDDQMLMLIAKFIIEETVTTLKQEFKQKESKFMTDFSNLKHLNDKLENKLHSQDQSIQIVHMMINHTQVYDQKTKTALEHFEGIQKSLVTEVRAMKSVFENLEAEVDQNETDLQSGEIERKNLLSTNENLVAECLSKDVFYTATDSVLNVSRFSDMHDAFTSAQKRITDLKSKNFNLRNKIQHDDHDSMIKHFSKLEVEHFNIQLKYQNLKERFGNKKLVTSSDAPSFDSLFVIGKLNGQIQSHGNTIRELKEKMSRLTKKNSNTDPTFDLKDQLRENSKCFTIPDCQPKVLAPGRYPIDVEPIPPRLKKNREVHLHYIKCLKESVETLREIVEDAKVERPLNTSLASACRYTKHSQELLEYVISTCPKDFGPRDKQNAYTNLLRNFMKKFIRTVRFGNDHFGAIMGYGDYVISDSVISRVYYVEGIGHNLFSIGQFCDSDLEVAFRKHTCFVRNLDGVDLIKESRGTNLYTISVDDMM
ncbi:hypothetical protein Tco_1368615, partial [Tanacetum coccineum]